MLVGSALSKKTKKVLTAFVDDTSSNVKHDLIALYSNRQLDIVTRTAVIRKLFNAVMKSTLEQQSIRERFVKLGNSRNIYSRFLRALFDCIQTDCFLQFAAGGKVRTHIRSGFYETVVKTIVGSVLNDEDCAHVKDKNVR